jgi:hypothetical protein
MTKDLENIMPLKMVHEHLPPDLKVSYSQLERWADKDRKIDFPEPVETLGRYRFYDKDQVIRWVILWTKLNKNMGRPNKKEVSNNG